ncbi:hypothetical protein ABH931_004679 [Streptacidiphilus sp. MAP12-33]|uniref:hypothetical protein n=1 Tax=Streptacidiphilus sp. MAP12-33 TaxID=3156266 RepID=UPI003514C940
MSDDDGVSQPVQPIAMPQQDPQPGVQQGLPGPGAIAATAPFDQSAVESARDALERAAKPELINELLASGVATASVTAASTVLKATIDATTQRLRNQQDAETDRLRIAAETERSALHEREETKRARLAARNPEPPAAPTEV